MRDIIVFSIEIPYKEQWDEWKINGSINSVTFDREIDVDKLRALKLFAETLGFKVDFHREQYTPGHYEKVEEL